MKPEDVRRLYRRDSTDADTEAQRSAQEARSDPDKARAFLKVIYSLSVDDPHAALVLRMLLEGMLMRYVEERAAADDDYALICSNLLFDLIERMRPPARGKPNKTRTA